MEPPLKRMRLSPENDPEAPLALVDTALPWTQPKIQIPPNQDEILVFSDSSPTKTLDIFDLRRRRPEYRRAQLKRNAGPYLQPRAPDVTVTANVVNIAIVDGPDRTSTTQIAAPAVETVLPLPLVGPVTIAAHPQVTAAVGSAVSQLLPGGSLTGGLVSSLTGLLPLPSGSTNGTSGERTVTVTATSSLHVTARNSTGSRTSVPHRKTTLIVEGYTTTIEEPINTDASSDYQFGDFSTSSPGAIATNARNNGLAATSSSSANDAAATDGKSGGGVVLTPQQQQVVGGVVGGVAGVALVLLGILYFLKWYRHRLKAEGRLSEQIARHRQLPSADDHVYTPTPPMSQPSGKALVPMAALKQSLQRLRPPSTITAASADTNRPHTPGAESERSFRRVAGRKIPSVLLTGGDGYGDNGPVSPPSEHSSIAASREVSQISSYRESNSSTNPFLGAGNGRVASYSHSTRNLVSPFSDPTGDEQDDSALLPVSSFNSKRGLSTRSQLSVQTAGLSMLNPNRHSEGSLTIKPSPARTPTTTSPTSSSLRLPMHTPPLMSGDIPEMPSLQPHRFTMGPRKFSDDALSVQRSPGPRSVSAVSVRSSSTTGRFKEDI